MKWWTPLAAGALLLAACSGEPVQQDTVTVTETMTATPDAAQADAAAVEPFDLDAFERAQGSGDVDRIRAFYTDDAVMMPFGHILNTLESHPVPEYWDVSGDDMVREAAEHEGGTFEFLDMRQNGNMVVTTGVWTFPDGMFPDSARTVIKTTSILHLRDGQIWRHFADFEVYVDGELIDM